MSHKNPKDEPCAWYEDPSGDFWVPECEGLGGQLFTFTDGGPKENHVHYCCYCGRRVEVTEVL